MTKAKPTNQRDTVLFVNEFPESAIAALEGYREKFGKPLKALLLSDKRLKDIHFARGYKLFEHVKTNFSNPYQLERAVMPWRDNLLAVICRPEKYIPYFRVLIPHIPYLQSPTQTSLFWTTDKISMRRLIDVHDTSLNPRFMVVEDTKPETLARINKRIGYPMIVKPSGLGASLLVSVCYHEEELQQTLKTVFAKVETYYKKRQNRKDDKPQILVEQLLEGALYSVDSYVDEKGNTYHCPPVHVTTGRAIGFDDFFGYKQLTPVKLKDHKVNKANVVVDKAIRALNLRSTTVHTEMKKTEDGWKIIELGPRSGGFRHDLYMKSFGINHALNDLLIRMSKKPVIPKRRKGYTVAMKFFAEKEGFLKEIGGLAKIKKLSSFEIIDIHKKAGDKCTYAKNGGTSVFDIIMHNKSRSELLADIRRLETTVDIRLLSKKPA